ncbi:MAG: hypothetical protein U0835_25775 [Isosphaeraceae bacterium]
MRHTLELAWKQGFRIISSGLALMALFGPAVSGAKAGEGPASLPDSRLGIRTAPILLLSRADVRSDLALTPQQTEAAERAITDLYVRAAALRGKSGAAALEERRQVDQAQRSWVETSLTSEQRNRLLQIDLQWEGPTALVSRPVVGETLGLDATQRQTIEKAVAARNASRAQGTGSILEEEATLTRAALAVLTAEQKTRWQAMLGRPFKPQLQAEKPAAGETARK